MGSLRVCEIYQIDPKEIYSKSREKIRAEARGLFCYWAVRELGYALTDLAKRLNMSGPGVCYAVSRGERIALAPMQREEIREAAESYQLREPSVPYGDHFGGKNGDMGTENAYLWETNIGGCPRILILLQKREKRPKFPQVFVK